MDNCHARDQCDADSAGHGKNYFGGRKSKKEEVFSLCESHPQREKVEKYAASFQKLADTFYGMPYRRDYLSKGQVDQILREVNEEVCGRCYHRELCWEGQSVLLCRGGEAIIRALEDGTEEDLRKSARNGQNYAGSRRSIWMRCANVSGKNSRILPGETG